MVIKWVDKRFIDVNKARETECTTNQVVWTERGQFWIPNFYVGNAMQLVRLSCVNFEREAILHECQPCRGLERRHILQTNSFA